MDTALSPEGDFTVDDSGGLCSVDGQRETAQKLFILLSVRLGSFIYDRELGSLLPVSENISEKEAESMARKALLNLPGAEVIGAEIREDGVCIHTDVDGLIYDTFIRQGGNSFE